MPTDTMKSPFFKPSEPVRYTQTPGGTRHRRKRQPHEKEHKSTILGCSSNLINAIVGSGIVGLPYAVQQAGFCAGIILIVLCAFLTEKSLRLLVETAKHAHVPTYEMVAEAAFGRFGFLFVAINMFIMAYGAMLSYLMIVKDTFSSILGVAMDDYPMKRAILFAVSISIMVPLSSQRDMADLAKTSRISVTFDILMVGIVLLCAPIAENLPAFRWSDSIVHWDTIFVGLGVLSFAFVCQHSAFIIAGSLDRPTRSRWGTVTRIALSISSLLALSCGVGGYIGYGDSTMGNILNNLDDSWLANLARGLLGTTMLFVYPMESFVARHVCVVLFFQGTSAHEGDDTYILNRRDRRVGMTVLLYLMALVPAALFENLGVVLAAAGAVGGSCLSYIGPGIIYLGIHGARFLELSHAFFGKPKQRERIQEEENLYRPDSLGELPLLEDGPCDIWLVRVSKEVLWYILLMPVWCAIASVGKVYLTGHVHELAMQSPHPIRIGNVRYSTARIEGGAQRVVLLGDETSSDTEQQQLKNQSSFPTDTILLRADSLPRGMGTARTTDGRILALPSTHTPGKLLPPAKKAPPNYQSTNEMIGKKLVQQQSSRPEEEEAVVDVDPQEVPPGFWDYLIAIFYISFGVLAMVAGLISIFNETEE